MYHNVQLESGFQSKFDCLRRLHTLDMTEDEKDRFYECTKVKMYSEEDEMDGNTSYKCLVEWNNMNKSQSWMHFFALSQ
jgi:hypothetical protein